MIEYDKKISNTYNSPFIVQRRPNPSMGLVLKDNRPETHVKQFKNGRVESKSSANIESGKPIQKAGWLQTGWDTAKNITGSLWGLGASAASLGLGLYTGNAPLAYAGGAGLVHGLFSNFFGNPKEESPYTPKSLDPDDYKFTTKAADTVTKPLSTKDFEKRTGRSRGSGVEVGDVASYKMVQWMEKTGDGLTGDHQPSGAAIKEALRLQLHKAKTNVLTRTQLANAYARAVTLVMTDKWHKAVSRTYGGRNTKKQISEDASDLSEAASKDWALSFPELFKRGFSRKEVERIERNKNKAQKGYFKTGDPQSFLFKDE